MHTDKRLAGILAPVFALRHRNDLGIGDTTAMHDAIEFCARHNLGVLQILPINETGGDNSPYNALSSIALDPVLVTIVPDIIPGLTKDAFDKIATADKVADLRKGSIQYTRVKALKLALLRSGFTSFKQKLGSKENAQIQDWLRFCQENKSWLEPYTLFRAIVDRHDGNVCWTNWTEDYRTYQTAQKTASTGINKSFFTEEQQFFSYVQWIAYKQWQDLKSTAAKLGVKLMGDLPFGISRYSADVWANPQLFDLSWSAGAPPELSFQADEFTRKWGQNWGFPLYNWQEHKREKFHWWRQRIKQLTKLFDYFRIDHVLGFFRIYSFPWIPEENGEFLSLTEEEVKQKTNGRLPQFINRPDYPQENAELNRAQGEHLLKIIIDAAGDTGIVAEDLGSVPAYVRPLLAALKIPGFSIPMFERNPLDNSYKAKESFPELNLATYATHDHMPIALFYENLVNWWHGPDGHNGWEEVKHLMRFLGLKEENAPATFTDDLHKQMIKTLLETPCRLVMFMIVDLLGEKQRFNEPNVCGEENWNQRLAQDLRAYEYDPKYKKKIQSFTELIKETNRLPMSSNLLVSSSNSKQ